MNGWLNLYKPRGISSAKAVHIVRKYLKNCKIGHTGTLDPEAEGVLPLAIGQATKLVSVLMNSKKQYVFTIQFGASSSTGDSAGEIFTENCHIPSKQECEEVIARFVGKIQQTPPAYSAVKVGGIRAYKLARKKQSFSLPERSVNIYELELLKYDGIEARATYRVVCSKGTYVRTLAEDISLSLQSLGFVIELRRTKVGVFDEQNSINISELLALESDEKADFVRISDFIWSKCLRLEDVLDDIPVLEVDSHAAQKIRYGQPCMPGIQIEYEQIWLKHDGKIVAIGSLHNGNFKSSRVFNYMENGEE